MLAGEKYPVIGASDFYFNNAKGCYQCLQLEYNGKTAVGMIADWLPTSESKHLDISPLLSQQLGFDPDARNATNDRGP